MCNEAVLRLKTCSIELLQHLLKTPLWETFAVLIVFVVRIQLLINNLLHMVTDERNEVYHSLVSTRCSCNRSGGMKVVLCTTAATQCRKTGINLCLAFCK